MKFIKILIVIYMFLFPFFSSAGILDRCKYFLQKEPVPWRAWTIHDHNPQNQQTAIRDNLMVFIDNGHIFAKDLGTEDYLHLKGPTNVKAIVLYGGNTVAALTEGGAVYQLENWDKLKWAKSRDGVQFISVSDLGDGREAFNMTSRLDPITLKPL